MCQKERCPLWNPLPRNLRFLWILPALHHSSLAQQESQSLSQNVKLGLQYRYQQGQVQVNHNRFLGYTKDADGHLVIDPAQAEIVKRIYREYLEGKSMDKIATGLEADGILTGACTGTTVAANPSSGGAAAA